MSVVRPGRRARGRPGGGDHLEGHRCPGEWIALRVMRASLAFLAREVAYEVPPQDLALALGRAPALPGSRFVIARVRPRG